MPISLPPAPRAYDAADQARLRAALTAADAETHKINRTLDLGRGAGLVFVDEVTGQRMMLSVRAGVLTLTAL